MIKLFHVGIKALITHHDKVLLLRRREGNLLWDFPGGRIDDLEEPRETLLRELAEELPGNEHVSIRKLIGCKRMPKDMPGGFGHLLLFYLVSADLPSPVRLSPEHESCSWVDPSALSELVGVPLEELTDELLHPVST